MEDDAHGKNVIIEGSSSWEAEKKWFQRRIKELESQVEEMKWKRVEDLKGNERVLSIFASKEEAWRCEKRQLVQQLEFQRFIDNEGIHNKVESSAEPASRNVFNYSRYVAELKRQKDKAESMLRNSLAEMEEWKLKAQEKKHVDAALRSVTDEMLRLQKEMEENDAFILSEMSKMDKVGFRGSVVQAELRDKENTLSIDNTYLRQYTEGEGSREREAAKWKRLYLGLKFELDNLQICKTNTVRENEDQTGGEIRRNNTASIEANLDRKPSEEMGCLKLERKGKNIQIEGLGKKLLGTEKKTSKREKKKKSHRGSLSMCYADGFFLSSYIQPYSKQRIQERFSKADVNGENRRNAKKTLTGEL